MGTSSSEAAETCSPSGGGRTPAEKWAAVKAVMKVQAVHRGNKTRQEVIRRVSEGGAAGAGVDPASREAAAPALTTTPSSCIGKLQRRGSVPTAPIPSVKGESRTSVSPASDLQPGAAPGSSASTSSIGKLQRRGSAPHNTVAPSGWRGGPAAPMLDNPVLAVVAGNPDVALGPSKNPRWGGRSSAGDPPLRRTKSEFEMSGVLMKRAGVNSTPQTSWRDALRKQTSALTINMALMPTWQRRFFVLQSGNLSYWHDEADEAAGRAPSQVIDLSGYEVLVDTADPHWGFELRPTVDEAKRTWYLRAAFEEERLEWAQRLVLGTYVSSSW